MKSNEKTQNIQVARSQPARDVPITGGQINKVEGFL